MSVVDLLPFAVLAGVLGMDVVSFPQVMLSRPIVAATIAGAFAGSAAAGLLLGVVVELFAIEMLAVGASRYPEWGSASVIGGGIFAALGASGPAPAALAAALAATLIAAWVSGWSMYGLRRMNGVLARRRIPALDRGDGDALVRLQLTGLTLDFLRGALVGGIGLALLAPLASRVAGAPGVPATALTIVVWGLALAATVNALWRMLQGTGGAGWYLAAGLGVGVVIVVAR